MRAPIKTSATFVASGVGKISDASSLLATAYGTYSLVAVIKNSDGVVEDGYVTSITNKRPGVGDSSVLFNSPPTSIIKGTQTVISATATIPGVLSGIKYSFWRRDARGWVMVQDYSPVNTFSWTPARVGDYTIEVRAQGPGAMSYEAKNSIEVAVTLAGESKASVTNVTISTIGTSARRPVTITATASPDSEKLMYKFIISANNYFYKETSYSLSPTLTFITGKAGTYKVQVLVKNDVSYGKYDYITDPNISMYNLVIN